MSGLIIAIVLFAAGMLLLAAEILTPGFGVCGISGIVLLVCSIAYTVANVPFGLTIVAGELVVIAVAVFALVKYAKKRQLYGKIFLTENLAFDTPADSRFFIGKEGVATTPLKPIGEADFGGEKREVYSEGVFIEKGARVKVVDVRDNQLFVKAVMSVDEDAVAGSMLLL